MGKVHIVFGPQGAGKTTYSHKLASDIQGLCFSIDDWMGQLYGPDLPSPLDLSWIMERVQRCEKRIWTTTSRVAERGCSVVLDLGFMKVENRRQFVRLAEESGLPTQLHYVDAPHALRRSRVNARNADKGETFAFEVSPAMFDFMETQFEQATEEELSAAVRPL